MKMNSKGISFGVPSGGFAQAPGDWSHSGITFNQGNVGHTNYQYPQQTNVQHTTPQTNTPQIPAPAIISQPVPKSQPASLSSGNVTYGIINSAQSRRWD
jgi:hypothetical protein